jgi:hypothetical protein
VTAFVAWMVHSIIGKARVKVSQEERRVQGSGNSKRLSFH